MNSTPELTFLPLAPDHVSEAYVAGLNDRDVVRLTEARHRTWTLGDVTAYVRADALDDTVRLYGVFVDGKRHIGNIRLSAISMRHRHCYLGYMIFDRSMWGRGYGTAAVNEACRLAFHELDLHRICADYYAVNTASARVFEKTGFTIEGVYRDHFILDGQFIDSVRVAKRRSDGGSGVRP